VVGKILNRQDAKAAKKFKMLFVFLLAVSASWR